MDPHAAEERIGGQAEVPVLCAGPLGVVGRVFGGLWGPVVLTMTVLLHVSRSSTDSHRTVLS